MGAAFSRDWNSFYDFYDFYTFYDFDDLLLTTEFFDFEIELSAFCPMAFTDYN